jgi:hypothetical protein
MPRHIVQRTFPEGLCIEADPAEPDFCRGVFERNAQEGITWISSFVSEDKTRMFCIYEARSREAVRKAALRNALPVDQITQVRVLDPYFYA